VSFDCTTVYEVRLLKAIPEANMVAAYLKAEISSHRFGPDVRQ
jgi:hypothetical protein